MDDVKTLYKTRRDGYSEAFRLRVHRSLSWLDKARERLAADDADMAFQCFWIAFNAAYAREIDGRTMSADRNDFQVFLNDVCALDADRRIYGLVWKEFSGAIRSLLDNRFVFQPFWDFHNGKVPEASWKDDFERARKKLNAALAAQDTATVLLVLFGRLYTLRNQIMHGGATFGSSANRNQLKDACNILNALLPLILTVMQEHAGKDWGRPFYPFVREI